MICFRTHIVERESKVLLDRIGKREIDAEWNMTGSGGARLRVTDYEWLLVESDKLGSSLV